MGLCLRSHGPQSRRIGDTFSLTGLVEPRIEPEIAFQFGLAPAPGMDETALLACIDWVGHAFEIVQSIFPGWKFSAPDTVAAFGLHGALLIGARHSIAAHAEEWNRTLSTFEIELKRDGSRRRSRSALRMCWGDHCRPCVISSILSRAIRSIRHWQRARSSRRERSPVHFRFQPARHGPPS